MDKPIYDYAVEYLEKGLSVIPVEYKGKRPLIKWKEYQKRLPTTEEIREWFYNKELNIGVVTGEVSDNLVVMDFDNVDSYKNFFLDGERRAIEQITMVVKTNRGVHVYLRTNDPIGCYKIEKIGLDIKGEGGYVVAPPSVHPSGVQYSVISSTRDIAVVNDLESRFSLYLNKGKNHVNGEVRTTVGVYPPCIVDMAEDLVKKGELDHVERLTLAAYLLHSIDVEKVMEVFKCSNDFDESKTRYQIEWLKNRDYKPYSCDKLIEFGICKEKCKLYPYMLREVK